MKIKKSYSYDDVLLVPKYSEIQHRTDVSTKVDLGRGIVLDIPILSANMLHVTGIHMAREIAKLGGMAVLHRFNNRRELDFVESVYLSYDGKILPGRLTYKYINQVAISVGTNEQEKQYFVEKFLPLKDWIKIVCIDVAHGHHINTKEMIKFIRVHLPEALIIAGNVATGEGAVYLAEAGADVIKIGVGGGSICLTRVTTGNGRSAFDSIIECRDKLDENNFKDTKIIADGGIKNGGDIIKSLCFADAVMLGNVLAGTTQAPGDIIINDGRKYKQYAGSSTFGSSYVEGVSGFVPYRGDVKEVIEKLMDGVRSGCSYQGVNNLEDLKINPEFVEITNSGLVESKHHDIIL